MDSAERCPNPRCKSTDRAYRMQYHVSYSFTTALVACDNKWHDAPSVAPDISRRDQTDEWDAKHAPSVAAPLPTISPTYYVAHPNGTYSAADPQPVMPKPKPLKGIKCVRCKRRIKDGGASLPYCGRHCKRFAEQEARGETARP